jgi:hypothetical protein
VSSLIDRLRGTGLRGRLIAGVGFAAIVAAIVVAVLMLAGDGSGPDSGSASGAGSTTTTSADPQDSVEVDDDADPLPTDTPAAVTEFGGVLEPTTATTLPPTSSAFEPAAITPFEESDEAAFVAPSPVEVPEQSTGIGGFTSNAVGCESDCITSAIITPQLLTADVGFALATNVATRTTVWMSTLPIALVGDAPTIPGADPIAVHQTASTTWSTTLGPLSFSTTYHVIVKVTDLYGNSRYAVTDYATVESPTPGQLVGNGGGCYYQCIVSGTVLPTDSYDTVLLAVTTSVRVDFDIAISQSEPGFVGTSPFLPHDEPFIVEQDSGTAIGGSVTGLEEDTTYHVVVTATDQNGFTAHAVGEFHTAKLPPRVPPKPTWVLIRLERVMIDEDGDATGRGEIKLVWGIPDSPYTGVRDYDKIDSGDTIVLPDIGGTWLPFLPGEQLPHLAVNATEQDRRHSNCAGGLGDAVATASFEDFNCGRKTTVAITGPHSLDWLDSLQPCSSFFPVAFGEDRACLVINSGNMDDDWVVFRAIISFTTWVEPDDA